MPNPWDDDEIVAPAPAAPSPAPGVQGYVPVNGQQRPYVNERRTSHDAPMRPGAIKIREGEYYIPGPVVTPDGKPANIAQGDPSTLAPGSFYLDAQGLVKQVPISQQDLTWQDEDKVAMGTGSRVGAKREISAVPFPEESGLGAQLRLAGTFFLTPDEEDRARSIKNNIPTAEFAKAPDGRTVVRYDANSPWAYMNAPGLSGEDVLTFGSQAVQYVPAAGAAGMASNIGGRAVVGGVVSGATSVGQDVAAGALAGDANPIENIDPMKAVTAAGGGAAGEVLPAVIGGALRPAARATANVAPPPVAQTLRELPVVGDAFKDRAVGSIGYATEAGIPLSRGQATGSYPQIAFEQSAARGARGESAGQVMRAFTEEQGQAVQQQARALTPQIGETPLDAAQVVQSGMREAEQAAKGRVKAAYDAVRNSDAAVSAPTIAQLPGRMRAKMEDAFISPEDLASLNPSSAKIYREIERLAAGAPQLPDTPGVAGAAPKPGGPDPNYQLPIGAIERVRQGINANLRSATGQDRAALQIMKREFDTWLEEAVDSGLMSGDENAIKLLKEARQLNRDYRATFGSEKGAEADRLVRRLTDAAQTESDAANLLFGTTALRGTSGPVEVVKRIAKATGKQGETWDALRSGAVSRLLGRLERTDKAIPSYEGYVRGWEEALDGPGKPLMRELFTPEEIRLIRQHVAAVKKLVPPTGTVNRSGTGYEIARALSQTFGALDRIPGFNMLSRGTVDAFSTRGANVATTPAGEALPRLPFGATLGAVLGVTNSAEQGQEAPGP